MSAAKMSRLPARIIKANVMFATLLNSQNSEERPWLRFKGVSLCFLKVSRVQMRKVTFDTHVVCSVSISLWCF